MKTHLCFLYPFILAFTGLAATGCGKGTADVPLTSAAVAPCSSCRISGASLRTSPTMAVGLANGEKLQMCIKRIKLEGDDDQPVKKSGETGENGEKDVDDIKFAPGLITVDATSATNSINWGTANIPVGFKLKRLKVKVKRDTALCGANFPYSVLYNDANAAHTFSTVQDVEFRFRFNPSIDLDDKTTLNVSLNSIIGAIETAAAAGSLASTDAIKGIIESKEDSGSKK